MIPRLLHFFWSTPDGAAMPPDVAGNVATWRDRCPGFEVRIWDVAMLSALEASLPDVPFMAAVTACRFPSMQSDLARFAILYVRGGYYNDLKNRMLAPFLSGIEGGSTVLTEHPPTVRPITRDVTSAFMGAVPGHPLFLRTIEIMCRQVVDRMGGNAFQVTGPGVLQKVLAQASPVERAAIEIIPYETAWGDEHGSAGWMRRTAASYNGADMSRHWSRRQRVESMYMDGRQPPSDS